MDLKKLKGRENTARASAWVHRNTDLKKLKGRENTARASAWVHRNTDLKKRRDSENMGQANGLEVRNFLLVSQHLNGRNKKVNLADNKPKHSASSIRE